MRQYLKEKREEKHLSQQNVAEKMEVTQQYYCMIENGERQEKINLDIIQKLAHAFEIPISYIIEQEEKLQAE